MLTVPVKHKIEQASVTHKIQPYEYKQVNSNAYAVQLWLPGILQAVCQKEGMLTSSVEAKGLNLLKPEEPVSVC